jgi:hypothetical protein
MKKIISFLAFLLLCAALSSALAQCHGKYQKLIGKGDTIYAPCADMVLLNMPTFESYYLANKNFEALKTLIPEYKSLQDSLNDALHWQYVNYRTIVNNQAEALRLEAMNKDEAMNEVVRLQGVNNTLRKGHKVKNIALGVLGTLFIAAIIPKS